MHDGEVVALRLFDGCSPFCKTAERLKTDVAFRVLPGHSDAPSRRTICEFRRGHLKDFEQLFVMAARLAMESGISSLGQLAVDGNNIRAHASTRKAMSYGRNKQQAARLESEVQRLLQQAESEDQAEDGRCGPDLWGDELPEALARRENRLKMLRASKVRLESQQADQPLAAGRSPEAECGADPGPTSKQSFGVPADRAQTNFTDSESRIMKTSEARGVTGCVWRGDGKDEGRSGGTRSSRPQRGWRNA